MAKYQTQTQEISNPFYNARYKISNLTRTLKILDLVIRKTPTYACILNPPLFLHSSDRMPNIMKVNQKIEQSTTIFSSSESQTNDAFIRKTDKEN